MEILRKLIYLSIAVLVLGCSEPDIEESFLDGEVIYDLSTYQPENYLISKNKPNPTLTDLAKPVIIAAHGYSASTFEWQEFQDWASSDSSILISQVLLGGHGLDYEAFKKATWKDWYNPIKDEYEALLEKGYTNISFAGSSTGGALLCKLIESKYFDANAVNYFFLIDPIVIPSNKTLSLVGVLGPMLGYVETGNTPEEDPYWYHFLPQETLKELNNLTTTVRKDLQKGFNLPVGSRMKVYKAAKDPSADPVSAVLLKKGLKTTNNKDIEVEMIETDIHVFTRLDLRQDITSKNIQDQADCFNDMKQKVLN